MRSSKTFSSLKTVILPFRFSRLKKTLGNYNVVFCLCSLLVSGTAAFANTVGRNLVLTRLEQRRIDIQNEARDKNSVQILEVGKPIEKQIAGRDSHYYQIMLNAGQFLYVVVDQRGVDVVMKLRDPKGKEIIKVDSPNSTHGPESLSFIADAPGNYILIISPLEKSAISGRYKMSIKELRIPTVPDRKRIAAEQAYLEGEQLRIKWKLEFQQKAVEKYIEALSLYNEIGDQYSEAMMHDLMGLIYSSWGERQKAVERFEKALSLFRAVHDTSGEASIFNKLGEIYATQSKSKEALEYYDKAYQLYQSVANHSGEASSLNYIGSIHYNLGQFEKALGFFERALPLSKALNYRSQEAVTLRNIGATYFALKKSGALKLYDKALRLQREVGDHVGATDTLTELLTILLSYRGKSDRFEEYSQLLSLSKSAWDPTVDPKDPLMVVGDSPAMVAELMKPYNTALSTFRAANNPFGEAAALNKMGLVYLALDQKDKALKCYDKALVIYRQINNLTGVGYTLHNLMNYWKNLGKPTVAIFYGKQAVNVYQELRRNIAGLDKQYQMSFLKAKQSTYRSLADLLISEERIVEAQQVLNLLKEEEFFQFVNQDIQEAASLTGQATYTAKEADWGKRYQKLVNNLIGLANERSNLYTQLNEVPGKDKQLATLNVELKKANQALEEFLKQLPKEASLAAKSGLNTEIPEAQDLINSLQELGPGVVALYTLVSEDKYSVLLISPKVRKTYQYSIKMNGLNRKVSAFKNALRNSTSNPLPLAQEMHRILVGPLAKDLKELNAQTLMWSLDGVLRTIPIAALHDGKQYMVERYQVEVFTPASRRALKDKPSPQWKGLGFGVSKEHGNFPDLPAVPDELRGIIYEENTGTAESEEGRIPGKIMLDDAFTEETLRQALQQRFPVVHIASHFHFDPNSDLDSFLLLGDGGRFSLQKVKTSNKLFDGIELLTLSACDTATSDVATNGKEVDGLAEIAQRQGAKAVIASLWPVADDSTALLMQMFYALKRQQPEMSKAEALRKAQLKLLQCQDELSGLSEQDRILLSYIQPGSESGCYSHPHYWAPFILIGNWR